MQTLTVSFPISDKLTDLEKRIVRDQRESISLYEALRDKDHTKWIYALLSSYIEKSSILAGYKTNELDKNQRKILIDEMVKSLKEYKWLGQKELELIIVEGLKGNLGDTYGYNLKSLQTWIKNFQNGMRMKALQKQSEYERTIRDHQERAQAERDRVESERRSREETIRRINQKIEGFKKVDSWEDIPEDMFLHEQAFELFEEMKLIEIPVADKVKLYNDQLAIAKSNQLLKGQNEEIFRVEAKLKSRDICFRKKLFDMIRDGKKVTENIDKI